MKDFVHSFGAHVRKSRNTGMYLRVQHVPLRPSIYASTYLYTVGWDVYTYVPKYLCDYMFIHVSRYFCYVYIYREQSTLALVTSETRLTVWNDLFAMCLKRTTSNQQIKIDVTPVSHHDREYGFRYSLDYCSAPSTGEHARR